MNSLKIIVPFLVLIVSGCASGMPYVYNSFAGNPKIGVKYAPENLVIIDDQGKSLFTKVIEKKEAVKLPASYKKTAEAFCELLKKEYPLDYVELQKPGKKYDYTIDFIISPRYVVNKKQGSVALKFMVIAKTVKMPASEVIGNATITSMSDIRSAEVENIKDIAGVFPAEQSLNKLLDSVKIGTKKWIKQIKSSMPK